MLNFALIIGSTRPNRFADHAAKWVAEAASARSDFRLDLLDLRDYPLPFFDQAKSPGYANRDYADPRVRAWSARIDAADGFIATAAEYNRGPTAVLKNALDSLYPEWVNKPIGFVGYGGVGGARAVEQLRLNAIELQMAPIRNGVHIALEPYLATINGGSLASFDYLNKSLTALFDQLVWWGQALKAAREPVRQRAVA